MLLTFAGLSLCLSSCNRSVGPGREITYPVKGQVFVNSKPGKGVVASLKRNGKPLPRDIQPRAVVDDQGNFVVSTYGNGDGAPEGEYVATFRLPEKLGQIKFMGGGEEPKDIFGGKYDDPATSTFKLSVTSGGSNDLGRVELEADMAAYEEEQAEKKAADEQLQQSLQGQEGQGGQ